MCEREGGMGGLRKDKREAERLVKVIRRERKRGRERESGWGDFGRGMN